MVVHYYFQDGTCNGVFGKIKSNCRILFEELEVPNENKEYFDGPATHDGTSIWETIARNVAAIDGSETSRLAQKLYLKISQNYNLGDEIHCIGFSRGAFICRTVNSFIRRYGIIMNHTNKDMVVAKWNEYEESNKLYNNNNTELPHQSASSEFHYVEGFT